MFIPLHWDRSAERGICRAKLQLCINALIILIIANCTIELHNSCMCFIPQPKIVSVVQFQCVCVAGWFVVKFNQTFIYTLLAEHIFHLMPLEYVHSLVWCMWEPKSSISINIYRTPTLLLTNWVSSYELRIKQILCHIFSNAWSKSLSMVCANYHTLFASRTISIIRFLYHLSFAFSPSRTLETTWKI